MERREIFLDDQDNDDFLYGLWEIVLQSQARCYAVVEC